MNELGPLPEAEVPRVTPGAEERASLETSRADQERIIADIQQRIAEAQPFLPRPEPLPAGVAYSPYLLEDLSPAIEVRSAKLLPPSIRNRLGRTQAPAQHRMTGGNLRQGRVGNVIRLTARQELQTLRYQERLAAWREAKAASIPARELLRRFQSGEVTDLSKWAAVRMKAGTSTGPTKLISDWFDAVTLNDRGDRILDVRSKKTFGEDQLTLVAREADADGQLKFFPVDEIGLRPLKLRNPGGLETAWRTVNQLARTSVLYLGLTAYAVPNLIGQEGFSVIHKGALQPLNDFWAAPKILRQVEAKSPVARERIRAAGGAGIVESLRPTSGPIPWLRGRNEHMANIYSRVLDNFWRDGGFVYEAKLRGYRTADDLIRLVTEGTTKGTAEHADILEIKHAVDEHFGAFDRLTDFEKNVLGEVIWFYPWLRASAVWTAKLPVHHPVKAAFAEIGGAYSRERAREDFVELFMTEAGVSRKMAEMAADSVMDFAPGVFLTEGGNAIDPRAISLASSPLEALQVATPLLQGDADEFTSRLFDQGTPAINLSGAVIEGVWQPPWGDPMGQRLAEAAQGYNRDVTLARRLSGDQGSWFNYTPEQAIGQRVGGIQSSDIPDVR